jgi:hypothetical protein
LVVAGEAGGAEGKDSEFCGIENTISSDELLENEAGVHEVGKKEGHKRDRQNNLGCFCGGPKVGTGK